MCKGRAEGGRPDYEDTRIKVGEYGVWTNFEKAVRNWDDGKTKRQQSKHTEYFSFLQRVCGVLD